LSALRHSFAVERMRLWYDDGVDVQARLPNLSVYMGHVRPQESYWYLSATPELLTTAAERFRLYAAEGGLS
jgi:integrase/recombinase XerD